MDWKKNKLKAITFSYDDGVTQDIRFINLLDKYDLKCTFNLNSELLGGRGLLPHGEKYVSHYKLHPSDVKRIYKDHEVAVHTLTHPRLPDIADDSEVIRQVEQDRLRLSELVEYDVVGMAYPCGGVNNDDRVAELIKQNTGVRYSRTISSNESFGIQENLFRFDPTVYHVNFDKMMELGRKFIEMTPDKPQIFYIWGHTYELDYEVEYWTRMEEFFKLISHKDDIFYGTNKDVLL